MASSSLFNRKHSDIFIFEKVSIQSKVLKPFKKPYIISEYNHSFPNECVHEKFPMFGSWEAFHDWDAIYQFFHDQGWKVMDFIRIDHAFALAQMGYVSVSKNFVHVLIPKSVIWEKNESGNVFIRTFIDSFHAGWNSTFDIEIIDGE